MSRIAKVVFFLLILVSVNVCKRAQKSVSTHVDFTWMSNTNWLVETEDVRVLLDGWITRIPRPMARPDLSKPETLSMPPAVPDKAGIQRVSEALDANRQLDFILSGHSHADHSFDTAIWAKLTGAHVIGPRSTCLQAYAQGIPKSQCTEVQGGETFDLGGGLSVRVVRWHHSGNIETPTGLLLQTPIELIDVPTPDPETGGLRPGILEDCPVGRCLAYLFTLHHPQNPISWFFDNSGNSQTFHEAKIADEAFFQEYGITLTNLEITPQEKSIAAYLSEAMESERLDSVDLWLGYRSSYYVEQVIPILKPKAFIPHHWGGLWSSFFAGPSYSFSNDRLVSVLTDVGIDLYVQKQFMDKFRLDAKGITCIKNDEIKKKLGFHN